MKHHNEYHINVLKNLFKDIPIKSIIVFTNDDCNIKVNNSNPDISLCTMYDLNETIEVSFKNSEVIFSKEEIDEIFDMLSKFSQMQEKILYDGKEESFISWLQPTLQNLEEERNKLTNQVLINKKRNTRRIVINTVTIIGCIFLMISAIYTIKTNYDIELEEAKQKYNSELEKFKQNFKHIDEIDNEYITALHEYFSVSDVLINELSSSATTFTAKISKANDTYGMALTEESKYIVMTSSSKVYEYNVFGDHLKYNRFNNMIGEGIRDYGNLTQVQFHGVTKNEITYIKITEIELFKLDIAKTIVKDHLELELYSK